MSKKPLKKSYTIYEARTHFSKLLKRVMEGEQVVIALRDKPIAKLVAYNPAPEDRIPGSAKDGFIISDDFDAPLPEDLLKTFQ